MATSAPTPLSGSMMLLPLQISSLLVHAARHHAEQQVVSCCPDGRIHRYTYAQCERRARRLAQALRQLGVSPGERVGTLAWNSYRHLELYYAISGSGAVCHTVNPRLFLEQIVYIINDAEDCCMFFDADLVPLVEKLAPRCEAVRHWVCLCDSNERPRANLEFQDFESLLTREDENFTWPELDERNASGLCYTSGTTGHPKGVLYSHRSTVLHSLAACLPDALCLDARAVILPAVPMFHANAWGLPYSAPLVGARLVLPGPRLSPQALYGLLESEQVTYAAGVPTVWTGLLEYLADGGRRLSSLRRALIGGSAPPQSMIAAFARHGVHVVHGWGMTETSPLATTSAPLRKHATASAESQQAICAKQGRSIFGVDLKIVGGSGEELPWDGLSMGQLWVRGHWVASDYFHGADRSCDGGWFPTGDIATVDADGYVQLKDRAKDLIKSGGEWIASIEIESVASAHPAVSQAACIARAHPKWGERPLLIVVRKPGVSVSGADLRAFFAGKVASWAIPDEVIFLEALPLTATGKVSKTQLREQFGTP
ncbi:MAG TPA: long-chain-fatty-acid--CoA ligase [Steroidobacteraceae bacterium]|nr:long-chain-fatty-acid--CoA ligase [Steroidobacteraceae bacterium]